MHTLKPLRSVASERALSPSKHEEEPTVEAESWDGMLGKLPAEPYGNWKPGGRLPGLGPTESRSGGRLVSPF